MKVLGIDFTSAPSRRKPITVATGEFVGGMLRIHSVRGLPSFDEFDAEIAAPGPWIAGIDFPFGQPAALISALNWPLSWSGYVGIVGLMEKREFETTIKDYSAAQPKGEKNLKRTTDKRSNSVSPMNVIFPPVGKMFFEGAPRILRSGASIFPCAPSEDSRVIVEAYAALVAETLAGTKSYKEGENRHQAERRDARARIVSGLAANRCVEAYGFAVSLEQADRERLVEELEADLLDAVLCAVQAAWASTRQDMGVPGDCDPLEGWIVDPSLMTETEAQRLAIQEKTPAREYSDNPLNRATTDPSTCHGKKRPSAANVDSLFLRRCIDALEQAFEGTKNHDSNDELVCEIYRAACVKEFELVLGQSGRLLRKRLAAWFSSNSQVDHLHFKDLFRHAARNDLIGCDVLERWLQYRDNLDSIGHHFGEDYADATLQLLPDFIPDARALADVIEREP